MIRTICGDFFKRYNVIDDNSVDLFVIDPPYGNNYKDWDRIDFVKFTNKYMEICTRKLKSTGTIWNFSGYSNLFTHSKCKEGLVNIMEKFGFVHLENWITWTRQKGRGSKKKLKSIKEEIIHFTNTEEYTWNNQLVKREVVVPYVKDGKPRGWILDLATGKRIRWTGMGNSWYYSSPYWNGILDRQRHSAQKPFMMIERLILLSSNEDDLVIDPFAGSFTTAMVSKYLKRNYIGFEINKKFYKDSIDYIKSNYNRIIKYYMEGKLK